MREPEGNNTFVRPATIDPSHEIYGAPDPLTSFPRSDALRGKELPGRPSSEDENRESELEE